MLSDDQIKTAWTNLDPAWGDDWRRKYEAFVIWARDVSEAELRTEAGQRKLWNTRAITSIGYGDAIDLAPVFVDAEIIDALVALRARPWPAGVEARAAAVQAEYERIIGLVVKHQELKATPSAKLHRTFAALLPDELTCVLSFRANRSVAELLLGSADVTSLAAQVKMRARLRDVLGAEADLAASVHRSIFCWWLYEHRASLGVDGATVWTPAKPAEEGPAGSEEDAPGDATPELVIWPFAKQFMGNNTARGFTRTYRAVVQAALPGLSREDLVELLLTGGGFEGTSAPSLRYLIIRIKGLGFLEERDGLIHASVDGHELLGTEQPDVLVLRLIERVFGVAQLLRIVERDPGADKQRLIAELQAVYPSWTNVRAPDALRRWCDQLGLIQSDAVGKLTLTSYGAAWARRLPAALPTPPAGSDEDDAAADIVPVPALDYPSFDAILAAMRAEPRFAGFVFEDRLLAALHAAWRSHERKRFVILSGLSGTGKTAVTLCYAEIVCKLMGIPVEQHREIVPVAPDWHDPSGLLGYFNALHADPTFQAEPALRLVLRAASDPGRPYFLLLDEMNLARVERYFAPFLSAMETGKDLVLHANAVPVNDVPARVAWPANLHIAGTVNMDETTHPFSDKVLDRAFTLELWDVDLPRFFERRGGARLDEVEKTLLELHEVMRKVRRHFGYRTTGEILAFVAAAPTVEGIPAVAFLDQAVFSKVLPRLRGDDSPAFKEALAELESICKRRGLATSEAKLQSMREMLDRTGVTRFWA